MCIFFMVNSFLCQYKLIAHAVGSKGGDNKENINPQKCDRQMGNAVCLAFACGQCAYESERLHCAICICADT